MPTSSLKSPNLSFGIIKSAFNQNVVNLLFEGLARGFQDAGIDQKYIDVYDAPGAMELPVSAKHLCETGKYSAVIALGCVIRGNTPHFEYVSAETTRGLSQVSLTTGIPVIFGVLTVNTLEDAMDRVKNDKSNKGYEAAMAAVEMAKLILRIKSSRQ
ncbi:MAG TPA: 6,7-dimethyl-8-ribityllumazine synthase [bacterium]|nr:6,7-dimethyl-8-ribityllumazine synthase [bacterium]HNC48014.1 6,7-dimethyl-8-ribityllumazine synthase [bacterium]HNE82715.1 6,7-dimethyl-8-ribityllumazine synthase [bacterium]HNH30081.1 6,7-dimethyl-8-ribityllumazine synthase [bacterium]HNH32732.1 6,7-dimethyl-8-ribityllumazine synthase [bacterium]